MYLSMLHSTPSNRLACFSPISSPGKSFEVVYRGSQDARERFIAPGVTRDGSQVPKREPFGLFLPIFCARWSRIRIPAPGWPDMDGCAMCFVPRGAKIDSESESGREKEKGAT